MKRRVPILVSIFAVAGMMSITAFGQFTSSIDFVVVIRKFGISLIAVL